MTDVKKLTSMLLDCENEIIKSQPNITDMSRIVATAEYLVTNRAIVLPCKIGDTLYYLDRYSKSIETDTVKYFTITKNGCKPILERHNIKFWENYEWGKTVFLSYEEAEEAERALKGVE